MRFSVFDSCYDTVQAFRDGFKVLLHDKYVAAASSTAQLVASFCDNILKIEAIKEGLHKMILEEDEAEAEFGFILVKVGDCE